ncbi:MAG: site-2 protease family protein [Myxococcales bacterium]|nr:site-2 protease family protein [Myxococcales bacterium]
MVVAVLALGLLVIVHEGGHFLAARWGGMIVSRFSVGFGPPIYRVKHGDTQFQVGVIPLGGYVQIDGMHPEDGTDISQPSSFINRPRHLRAAAILAGPLANYLLAFVMLVAFYVGFAVEPRPPFEVLNVREDSGAAAAGLQSKDRIVGVEGIVFDDYRDLSQTIALAEGNEIPLVIQRGEEQLTVPVTPQDSGGVWRIGIEFGPAETVPVRYGLGESITRAGTDLVQTSRQLLLGLVALVSTPSEVSVSGPVGMIRGLSSQVQRSTEGAYRWVAQLSIMLGFFNLLPIPALDGGRLVFLMVGAVRRKEIEPRLEAVVHGFGFLVLLSLMVVVSWFDLAR